MLSVTQGGTVCGEQLTPSSSEAAAVNTVSPQCTEETELTLMSPCGVGAVTQAGSTLKNKTGTELVRHGSGDQCDALFNLVICPLVPAFWTCVLPEPPLWQALYL